MGKLTDKAIKAAQPSDKQFKLHDGDGLYLLIHPNGSKYWRLRYFIDGKEKLTGIGKYPDMSLKEARERTYMLKMDVRRGIDPVQAKRAEKSAQVAELAQSFERIATDYMKHKQGRWSERYSNDVKSIMVRDVFPAIGSKPINGIRPADILALLQVVEQRGAVIQARKVRSRIMEVFNYAIALELCESNPAEKLANVLQRPEHGHNPFLQGDEIPAFLDALERYNGSEIIKSALWLITFTGCRTIEARLAEWKEFDLAAGIWSRPASHMKSKRDHVVPLPRQAIAMLERLKEHTGFCGLVFPGRLDLSKPINPQSLNNALYLMGYKDRLTPHGIRSTISTLLYDAGYAGNLIESQLSHIDQNTVRRAYNHAEYIDQRREMMQNLADWYDTIRQTGQGEPMNRPDTPIQFPSLAE